LKERAACSTHAKNALIFCFRVSPPTPSFKKLAKRKKTIYPAQLTQIHTEFCNFIVFILTQPSEHIKSHETGSND
jgi:hypothetical protein